MFRLPYLVTILPENGIPIICPTGNAKSNVPSSASLKWSIDLISGIRLAQVANENPIPKKNKAVANRTLFR